MYIIILVFIFHVYSQPLDNSDQIINIHLIPHSHDDAGWLYTFKEYYEGFDTRYCVKCELDTILSSMQLEKTRTFSWSEISFFKQWYQELPEHSKEVMKELIKQKRFEFVGGSWVMNDEATANYQNIIDQIRLGLVWLKQEFNVNVKTAWFLDTFGHSVSNAAILAKMGYENLVFARIDWREKTLRSKNKSLEFFWRPYYSYDKGKTKLFTHVLIDHYNPPIKTGLRDMIYDPYLGNPNYIANSLLNWAYETKTSFLTNHRIILFGDDFTFKNADTCYKNIELIMKEINLNYNLNTKIKLFYSTVENYFNALRQSSSVFPYYNDNDFFPYSDFGNFYWTGFFTSRPFLKGLIVDSSKYLSTASRMYLEDLLDRKINYTPLNKENITYNSSIDDKEILSGFMRLRENLAISQHHDAVTGTSREDVAFDYIERLSKSIDLFNKTIKFVLLNLISGQTKDLSNMEKLIDICFYLGNDCRKKYDQINRDSHNLLVILNPGLNTTYHLKLNVSFLNFDVVELDEQGERKIKFDTICSNIHNSNTYSYCTAFIDLEFKKNKLFSILIIKRVENEKSLNRKKLIFEHKKIERRPGEDGNNNDTPIGYEQIDRSIEKDLNLVTFNRNFDVNCLINITTNTPNFFMINQYYYSTNNTATFFIYDNTNNNFYVNLDYLKNCKVNKVVKINNIHYFSFNESFQINIDSKGYFQTLSDLNHFKHDVDTKLDSYLYYNFLIYNDSTYTISFDLKEQFLIYNKKDNTNYTLKFSHCVISNDNSKNYVYSGSYILSTPEPLKIEPLDFIMKSSFIYEGETVKEINLDTQFSTLKIRVYNSSISKNMFEVESILDPNFIYNDFELMLLIQTNLDNSVYYNENNHTEFWTDSNSMRMIRRVKNYRFGWNITDFNPKNDNFSANFYPVNHLFALKNNTNKFRETNDSISNYSFLNINDSILTVFNDRPQGFNSHKPGEILISLTRFSSVDDRKGLDRGISEYHSQYSFLHLNHIISFNTLETDYFIDQMNKKPMIFNLDLNSSSFMSNITIDQGKYIIKIVYSSMKRACSKESIIDQMIIMDDCIEMNIYIESEKKFFLQFFNKNDYFFHKIGKGKVDFSEKFYQYFNIKETSLNTINYYKNQGDFQRYNLRKQVTNNTSVFSIDPQDFKTFLIEFK